MIAHVVKRYERRQVGATVRRMAGGTPAWVETLHRQSQGDDVINTTCREQSNATFRARRAGLTLAHHTLPLQQGMSLIGMIHHICAAHTRLARIRVETTPAMAAGLTE